MRTLHGLKVRLLQLLAMFLPGGTSTRIRLHRWRGVEVGEGTFIGTDVMIETMAPELVSIGKDAYLGVRSVIVAHFNDVTPEIVRGRRHSVRIEDQAWVGPGALIMPGVTIGARSVIGAGSVVTKSIPPDVFAAGNPCRVIRPIEN